MEIDITWFKENAWYILLFAILITSLTINLNVTLNEKLVFGDEGLYAATGQYMAENLEIPVESPFSGGEFYARYEMKPPMTFLSTASFYFLGKKIGMRALVPVISIISASFIFLLGRKLYSDKAGVFAALFYLTMPALVTHTVFLYTEHLALMFLAGSFYFLYNYLESENKLQLIISGILLGFSINTEESSMIASFVFLTVLYKYKVDWKGYVKEIATIAALSFLIISPWMIAHNYSQIGDPGFQMDRIPGMDFSRKPQLKKDLPEVNNEGLKSATEGGGTSKPLHEFGLLNYIEFAYALPIFILALLGFSWYASEWRKKHLLIVLWALLSFGLVYMVFGWTRVEGLSRNTLLVIGPLSIAASLAASKIYDYLGSFESAGKSLAIIFLVILLGWSLFTASSKASQLRQTKRFSPAFFEGCDWIRENTAEDATVYNLWENRAEYHCKRSIVSNSEPPITEKAVVAANNKTYEVFKALGIDYLYIQKFSIKSDNVAPSYPLEFIQYIEKSPHYQQVYSYPQNCLYNQETSDCVVVYEMVDENETTEQSENIDLGQMMEQG